MEIPDIEALIPHRQRMKLIGKIVAVDFETATTESVLTQNSPLVCRGYANPVILIELAAQTAGYPLAIKNIAKPKLKIAAKGG